MSDILYLPDTVRKQVQDSYSIKRSITNSLTGSGGKSDLVNNTRISAPSMLTRGVLESLYIESWAAAKVIDLIVDDVFAPGISWDEDDSDAERLIKHLADMEMWQRLSGAVKSGRLYGTALMIACPSNDMFEEPLVPEQVRPGDIANLVVVDKDYLSVHEVYDNPSQPLYGKPYSYRWNYFPSGRPSPETNLTDFNKIVHASRCFKFDGIETINDIGWLHSNTERWWGYSVLQRVIDDLLQDIVMAQGGADAVKRTGMPVIMLDRFRETLSKGPQGGDPSVQQYADEIALNMDFRKVGFLDSKDKVDYIQVNNSGMIELIDNQVNRIAMIAGVPITRFTGESASGLSATGNGDARDWRTTVEAYRERVIEPHMNKLMMVMARNAGLGAVPDWEWGRLGELTMQEEVDAIKGLADAISKFMAANVMTEDEARDIIASTIPKVNLEEGFDASDHMEEVDDSVGIDRSANL